MSEENTSFYVNYDMVIETKSLLPVTRLLALDLKKNPYMSIGDFLKDMPDNQLEELLNHTNDLNGENSVLGDFIIMSMMLAAAEGLDSYADSDTAQKWANSFISYLALESLHRKGLVKLHRENLSFGDDYKDKIIVEKIQQ